MARTEVPTPLNDKLTLLKDIKTKVDNDGSASPLAAMLASKGIDLTADTASGVLALTYDASFKSLDKSKQKCLQQRNQLMKQVIIDTTGSLQYLKILFDPNFKEVGDWGATITDTGKFTYPINDEEWMNLFTLLKAKHDSYIAPAISPLLTYITENLISLTVDATSSAAALAKQTSFDTFKLDSEKAREKRDTKMAPIVSHLKTIISFLKKLYPNDLKTLGDYGITVVEAVKVKKPSVKVIKASTSKLNIRAEIGSTIVNSGTIPLPIYKGKTISGTPLILAVGEW